MRTVPVNMLCVGIDMQMQLEDTGHIVKIHVVLVFVSALQPRRDSNIYFLQHYQVRFPQVADCFKTPIFENNKMQEQIKGIISIAHHDRGVCRRTSTSPYGR